MSAATDPNFVILYVRDAAASAAFYADLLGKPPVEASPTFAMFALASGVMLGLWGADGVLPPATPTGPRAA
jgi:catechol 2,3-dioxygenase-like lactoylglutathione lyase family enzyme